MKGNGNGAPASPFAEVEEFAGFLMAHAIWSVSEGSTLTPMIGFVKDGERTLMRIEEADMKEAVGRGQAWIETNPEQAERAVFIHDGFVRLPSGRTDALLAVIREYGPPPMALEIVVPYRNSKAGRFAVHCPKFQAARGIANLAGLGEAFFKGVNDHEHGARIWNEHLDQSI
ncbi:MAG: hypothetical protein ACREE7_17100 [Dongiaceae bacterium]